LRRAAERARALHSRQLLPIATGEIAVALVMRLIMVGAVLAALSGALLVIRSLGMEAGLIALAGAGLFLAVVMAFTQYVRTAYYTCLYLWAAAREQAGETAPAPAPLAAALSA